MIDLTLLLLELGHQRVGGLDLIAEVHLGDAGLGHDRVGVLEGHADEGDLLAPDLEDLVGLERGRPVVARRVLPEHVRAEVLEVGTVEGLAGGAGVLAVRAVAVGQAAALLHAQQLGDALVELVVAHRGDVELHLVHGLDRRLVVEGGREQRAGADEVAGGDGQGRGARGARLVALLVELVREEGRASGVGVVDPPTGSRRRLQVAVEVVDGEQVELDVVLLVLGRLADQLLVDLGTAGAGLGGLGRRGIGAGREGERERHRRGSERDGSTTRCDFHGSSEGD